MSKTRDRVLIAKANLDYENTVAEAETKFMDNEIFFRKVYEEAIAKVVREHKANIARSRKEYEDTKEKARRIRDELIEKASKTSKEDSHSSEVVFWAFLKDELKIKRNKTDTDDELYNQKPGTNDRRLTIESALSKATQRGIRYDPKWKAFLISQKVGVVRDQIRSGCQEPM